MRRIVGAVVIREMAVDAGAAGQAEVIVHMTQRALQAGVGAGEREPGSGVIERRARPVRGRVTRGAVLWETRGFMRRIVGAVVVR